MMIVLGMRLWTGPNFLYAPTLVANVAADIPAILRETFGPVLTLQGLNDDQPVSLSDDSTSEQCAGIFTRDLSRAMRGMRRVQAGTVWINRYGRSRDHILPTGGYRQSGIGKDLGHEANRANRQSKTVLIDI